MSPSEKTVEKVKAQQGIKAKTSLRDFRNPFLDLKVVPPEEAIKEILHNNHAITEDTAREMITINYLGMQIETLVAMLNSLADLHLSVVSLSNKMMAQQKQTQKILKALIQRLNRK